MSTRVLLADDHSIMCDGLRRLLQEQDGMEVVAEAHDGRTAVRLAIELRPDVVVVDVAMPDLNGMEATRRITAGVPEVKVIALSMHADKQFVLGMFKAGASAYLLKECTADELTATIEQVLMGRHYVDPRIASTVVQESTNGSPRQGKAAVLTTREREVLQLLAEGRATKQIASILGLSVKTVESHRRQVMEKLDIHSVPGLTKYAIREGLTSLAV